MKWMCSSWNKCDFSYVHHSILFGWKKNTDSKSYSQNLWILTKFPHKIIRIFYFVLICFLFVAKTSIQWNVIYTLKVTQNCLSQESVRSSNKWNTVHMLQLSPSLDNNNNNSC